VRPPGFVMSTRALALFSTLLATACADNQESLLVLRAPAWTSEDCVVDAGQTDSLPFGTLDVTMATGYLMPAVLLNNLAKQTKNNAGVVTNEIQLTDVDVDLSAPQAPELIDAVSAMDDSYVSFNVQLSTDSLLPQAKEGVLVEVIPQPTAKVLRDLLPGMYGPEAKVTVVATAVFHATRSGNTSGKIGIIDARDFKFPVEVCQGCLVDCTSCPEEITCPDSTAMFVGGLCGNAQDAAIAPEGCDLGTM
jgi:hypothetical protein